jgi:L-alanine-DL-glutamate epimerase-like enolase superfamily enzyme
MRITTVETTFITVPFARTELWAWGVREGMTSAVITVRTDTGVIGVGESVVGFGPTPAVVEELVRSMADLVIGGDPRHIEVLTGKVIGEGGWHYFRQTSGLVWAGIEMACWDILGKACNLSVVELLGGPIRDSVPAMFYVWGNEDVDGMAEYAREGVERGFGTFYVKVGIEEARDIEVVRKIREAIGPHPRLRADANEAWTPGTAVRMARKLAAYDLEFIEQPTMMYDIDGLAHVRRAGGVPVAANQASWGGFPILELIKRGACDIILTDPHQEGGIWGFKKAAALAEVAGIPIVSHSFGPSAIVMSASLAVACSSPNFLLAGQAYQDLVTRDFASPALSYAGGMMPRPTGPGLGVELDVDGLELYAARFRDHGYAAANANSSAGRMTFPNQ